MPYFHQCPYCGCSLDPGELCDCQNGEKENPPENESQAEKTAKK